VDHILQADRTVHAPNYDMMINLKIGKALGLAVPQLIARCRRVD
jgi:hypothetical protein